MGALGSGGASYVGLNCVFWECKCYHTEFVVAAEDEHIARGWCAGMVRGYTTAST